jgi:hypothetical protein
MVGSFFVVDVVVIVIEDDVVVIVVVIVVVVVAFALASACLLSALADFLLSALALPSIFKVASLLCVLSANSAVSLAFVSSKVSRFLTTTMEAGQQRGWVGE